MSSFYNPYSPKVQWGQGIQDMMNQIMQIMMLKKMMGGGQGGPTQSMGQTPMPGNALGSASMGSGAGLMGGAPSAMQGQSYPGAMGGGQGQQIDPQIMALIQKLMSGGGMGRM
jgi:hypothetical protein